MAQSAADSVRSPSNPGARLWLLRRLGAASPGAIVAVGLLLIALIGLLDYAIGTEVSVTLFYLLPIALLAWYLGWRWGVGGSILSTLVWLAANVIGGLRFSQPGIYVWNSLMRLGTFVVVAYLFVQLRRVLQQEQQLARTDYVTGALNSRAFYEILQAEIARANRYQHPLTLAYLDLDDFKSVNDQLGHSAGDAVLRALATTVRGVLRASDQLARMGGDEFVLLLPETGSPEARAALEKVQRAVLEAMQAHDWPVTLSLGALVCRGPLPGADDLLRAADDLMYSVKRAGKNNLQFGELPAQAVPAGAPPVSSSSIR